MTFSLLYIKIKVKMSPCQIGGQDDSVVDALEVKDVDLLSKPIDDVQDVADPVDRDGDGGPGAGHRDVKRAVGCSRCRQRHLINFTSVEIGEEEKVLFQVIVEAAGCRSVSHLTNKFSVRVENNNSLIVGKVELHLVLGLEEKIILSIKVFFRRIKES